MNSEIIGDLGAPREYFEPFIEASRKSGEAGRRGTEALRAALAKQTFEDQTPFYPYMAGSKLPGLAGLDMEDSLRIMLSIQDPANEINRLNTAKNRLQRVRAWLSKQGATTATLDYVVSSSDENVQPPSPNDKSRNLIGHPTLDLISIKGNWTS